MVTALFGTAEQSPLSQTLTIGAVVPSDPMGALGVSAAAMAIEKAWVVTADVFVIVTGYVTLRLLES